MTVDPLLGPGRRLYEQARKLRRTKQRWLLSRVTAVPTEPGVVLEFPKRPTPPDQEVS